MARKKNDETLLKKLAKRKGITDPKGLAAWIKKHKKESEDMSLFDKLIERIEHERQVNLKRPDGSPERKRALERWTRAKQRESPSPQHWQTRGTRRHALKTGRPLSTREDKSLLGRLVAGGFVPEETVKKPGDPRSAIQRRALRLMKQNARLRKQAVKDMQSWTRRERETKRAS